MSTHQTLVANQNTAQAEHGFRTGSANNDALAVTMNQSENGSDSTDTICALATGRGVAGLAVVRISGPQSFELAERLFQSSTKISSAATHTIHYGRFNVLGGTMQDEVTLSLFRAPRSYTGEDVIEIGCHGGDVVPRLIIQALLQIGARMADAGEFTKRAFLNGKIDLTQVESVAELIHSSSSESAAIAAKQLHGVFRDNIYLLRQKMIDLCGLLELELDFAQEDLELIPKTQLRGDIDSAIAMCTRYSSSFHASQVLRSGFTLSFVGLPNAGKSMLFNNLIGDERSIVHDEAGTTRDFIREYVEWDGLRINISDTAGIRETESLVESKGIELSNSQASNADMIVVVNDAAAGRHNSDNLVARFFAAYPTKSIVLAQNKSDLIEDLEAVLDTEAKKSYELFLSAKSNTGVEQLRKRIVEEAQIAVAPSKEALLNERHLDLLNQTIRNLEQAKELLDAGEFAEIVSYEVRKGIECMSLILGETFSEEVLHSVFSKFCIGK